jgi:transposase
MLTLPASVRVYFCTQPVDLRRGIDGLGALVRTAGGELYSGHLYVFRGRRADRVKILSWDRGGFVLYYKRLERGRFHFPKPAEAGAEVTLSATQLAMLLDGLELAGRKEPVRWQPQGAQGLDSRAGMLM